MIRTHAGRRDTKKREAKGNQKNRGPKNSPDFEIFFLRASILLPYLLSPPATNSIFVTEKQTKRGEKNDMAGEKVVFEG